MTFSFRYDSSSVSEFSKTFSGLLHVHVTDPQLYDGMHVSHDMTQLTKWLCAQRRLRSAWASAQSDQSSVSAWRNLGALATHWAHSEDSYDLVSLDCNRVQAPIHKFRDPCVPETELWHLVIQLPDNGLDLCGASRPPISEEDCLCLFPY